MLRSKVLFRPCLFAGSLKALNSRVADASKRKDAEKFAKDFSMQPMVHHERSSFEYKGSTKGAEVGARNEAAYMDYEEFKPKSLTRKFAMPGLINLLTISPVYCALLCIGAATWGIFYWDQYCQKHYITVLIARPNKL